MLQEFIDLLMMYTPGALGIMLAYRVFMGLEKENATRAWIAAGFFVIVGGIVTAFLYNDTLVKPDVWQQATTYLMANGLGALVVLFLIITKETREEGQGDWAKVIIKFVFVWPETSALVISVLIAGLLPSGRAVTPSMLKDILGVWDVSSPGLALSVTLAGTLLHTVAIFGAIYPAKKGGECIQRDGVRVPKVSWPAAIIIWLVGILVLCATLVISRAVGL